MRGFVLIVAWNEVGTGVVDCTHFPNQDLVWVTDLRQPLIGQQGVTERGTAQVAPGAHRPCGTDQRPLAAPAGPVARWPQPSGPYWRADRARQSEGCAAQVSVSTRSWDGLAKIDTRLRRDRRRGQRTLAGR
jgi:hypothetical protein